MTHTLSLAALLSALLVTPALAAEATATSVGDLYKDRAALSGKQVTVHGKVAKFNKQIMERNWVHLRDGTGDAADGSNDITVTTQDTAAVNDEVTATGTLVVDMDFGAGYKYPLLIEKATITPAAPAAPAAAQ
ncbi:hypothetical protein [uncultured Thiodictyon sp.]|uniref:hypothetical protein n=1 Tax=uncultured Thiodictyon sp. TaxID=1846217 RepID=UPI0025D4824E|nr:hypothetical protein [uncultured Thiodictyon sp.]